MPGYVTHLALSKKYLDARNISDEEYISRFIIGSIVADVARPPRKKETHFWTDDNYLMFVRKPCLDSFLNKYGSRLQEPFVKGYYSHLLLDKIFIEKYWGKHFCFFDAKGNEAFLYDEVAMVEILDDNSRYSREEFFSSDLYYGDYDRMNPYLINKYLLQLPEIAGVQNILGEGVIEEICTKDSAALIQMLSNINRVDKENCDCDGIRVFNMKEYEKLLDIAMDVLI